MTQTINKINITSTANINLENTFQQQIDSSLTAFRIPTLNELIHQGTDALRYIKRTYEGLSPFEQGILGAIPFAGDTLDLAIQAHRQATGKGADPVIVTLSAIGLGADFVAAGTAGLGETFNVGISILKVAYKTMSGASKASMRELFQAAAKDPNVMKIVVGALTELLQNKNIHELLSNPKFIESFPRVLKAKIISYGKGEVVTSEKNRYRQNNKADDKNNSILIDLNNQSQINQDLSLERFEEIKKSLAENGINSNDPSFKEMLATIALATGVKDPSSIIEHAGVGTEEANKLIRSLSPQPTSNTQLTPG